MITQHQIQHKIFESPQYDDQIYYSMQISFSFNFIFSVDIIGCAIVASVVKCTVLFWLSWRENSFSFTLNAFTIEYSSWATKLFPWSVVFISFICLKYRLLVQNLRYILFIKFFNTVETVGFPFFGSILVSQLSPNSTSVKLYGTEHLCDPN